MYIAFCFDQVGELIVVAQLVAGLQCIQFLCNGQQTVGSVAFGAFGFTVFIVFVFLSVQCFIEIGCIAQYQQPAIIPGNQHTSFSDIRNGFLLLDLDIRTGVFDQGLKFFRIGKLAAKCGISPFSPIGYINPGIRFDVDARLSGVVH